MLSTRGCKVCWREKAKQLAHQVAGADSILLDLHDIRERLVARLVA